MPQPFRIAENRAAKTGDNAFVYNLVLGLHNAIREAVGDLVDRLSGESAEASDQLAKTKQPEAKILVQLHELGQKRTVRKKENGHDSRTDGVRVLNALWPIALLALTESDVAAIRFQLQQVTWFAMQCIAELV